MEKLLIADFGSQYTLLIARRARELGVYAEIVPYYKLADEPGPEVKGVVFSGSYASVSEGPPLPERWIGRLPALAICYSAQWIAAHYGGAVIEGAQREYGPAKLLLQGSSVLFEGMPQASTVWMSHADTITALPPGAQAIAATENIPYAAYQWPEKKLLAVQFHPEVSHTTYGPQMLENFLRRFCGFADRWEPESLIESLIADLRQAMPEGQAVCALSGGIDSTVAAVLAHKAIGERFQGFFVDTGLLRKGEREAVLKAYESMGLPVTLIEAQEEFLRALKGITDPEEKRRRIGHLFIEVFEKAARSLSDGRYLIQGTIYPDVVESGASVAPTIKSHHNVGGLPEKLPFQLVEPLRLFFKDEVRRLGEKLGLPRSFLRRHPFPGPGLAVRILGEVTPERLDILREADAHFIDTLEASGWYDRVWQAFAVLLPVSTVGVTGDNRAYGGVVALRAVLSNDGMTAEPSTLPYEVLFQAAQKILQQVPNITRVVYDLSSKPPATIEWE